MKEIGEIVPLRGIKTFVSNSVTINLRRKGGGSRFLNNAPVDDGIRQIIKLRIKLGVGNQRKQ